MSIVEDVRDHREPVLSPAAAKAAGLLLALAMALGQIVVLMNVGQDLNGHLADQAAEAGSHLWWSDSPMWLVVPAIVTMFLPLSMIPGAFGWSWRQIMPPSVRWRWPVAGALAMTCLVTDAFMLGFGRVGGYATATEAVWTSGGQIVERHSWTEARKATIGCFMLGKGGEADRKARLYYTVDFGGKRQAKLGYVLESHEGLAAWAHEAAAVDAALPAAVPVIRTRFDPACAAALNRIGQGIPALPALLRLPGASPVPVQLR